MHPLWARGGIYIGVAFAAIVICLVGCFQVLSPDLYWHLKMGRDLLQQGLTPFRDHYSFTYPEAPIIMVAWPFQIAVSSFFDFFGGILGIAVFRILVWTTALYFNFKLWRRMTGDKLLLFLALLIFLFTLVYHSEPRPDQISLLFEPILILLLLDWRRDPAIRQSVKIGLLLFLWSNIHVSSIMGYVCVAGFLIERAWFMAKSANTQWRLLFLTGAAWTAIGFLNADLMHPLLQQATLKPEWADYITEYESFPFALQFQTLRLYWILLALAGAIMIYKKEYAGAFITAVIGFKTAEMTKLFPHLMIMTLPFMISSFECLRAYAWRSRPLTKYAVTGCFLIANVFIFLNVVDRSMIHPMHPIRLDADRNYFPFDVVTFAKRQAIKGTMLNDYGMGGFLLHELSPDIKIYIDGRSNILFPLDHMQRFFEVQINADFFKAEVAKYDIKYVVGRTDGTADLVSTALDSGLFSILFLGRNAALLERGEKPNLLSNLYLHPECLEARQIPELEELLASTGADEPMKKIYIDSALLMLKKAEKRVATSTLPVSTFLIRLAGERAWREDKLHTAFELIGEIPRKSATDLTNLADLDCRINSCRSAESILSRVPKAGLTPHTLFRGQKILEHVRTSLGFHIFTAERYASLVARVQTLKLDSKTSGNLQIRNAECRYPVL